MGLLGDIFEDREERLKGLGTEVQQFAKTFFWHVEG